jgi:hypothetical protein
MMRGYYDEALGSVRTVSEIANLLWLFHQDTTAEIEWKTAASRQRRRAFGPAAVRSRLARLGLHVPVDTEVYGELSEVVIHVHPNTRPQAYNAIHRAVLAGHGQEAGVFIVLNELAKALPFLVVSCPKLLDLPNDVSRQFLRVAKQLVRATGAVELRGWLELRRTGPIVSPPSESSE